MTTYAYVTYIDSGTGDEGRISCKRYYSNAKAAIANSVEDCESLGIRVSEDDLTIDRLMNRIWSMKPILRSLGRVCFSVLGWTKDTKLVWVNIERIELKG